MVRAAASATAPTRICSRVRMAACIVNEIIAPPCYGQGYRRPHSFAPSIRDVEQRTAIGAAAFQAGKVAAVAHAPAVVEPGNVDARSEHARTMRLAGPPARIRDAHRGREAEAFRRAAMQLWRRRERLLQVPALSGGCGPRQHQKQKDEDC